MKKLRLKAGLTQAQLAHKLAVSPSTIGMYEQDRREPDHSIIVKMCQVLSTSGDYLLNIDAEYSKETRDVYNVILGFIDFLETQNNLMFNGEPINNFEKERISAAIKIATAVTMSELSSSNNV